MNRLRILVADDHEIVRRGLVSLIKGHPDWEVCAEAGNGRQAVEQAKEARPDIAILDIGMPVLNGLEATRQILRENPGTRILILTITDTDQAVQAVLDAGARGFLLKSDAVRDLVTRRRSPATQQNIFHRPGGGTGAVGLPRQDPSVLHGRTRPARSDFARARSGTAPGRGKVHQGSGLSSQLEREDGRDPPQQYHAKAWTALGQRTGAVRGAQQHRTSRRRPCVSCVRRNSCRRSQAYTFDAISLLLKHFVE